MAPSKKDDTNLEQVEEKLVNLLNNEPDVLDVQGIKLKIQRPTFTDKYRSQGWSNRKLKEVDVASDEVENQQIVFYLSYFGIINAHVTAMKLADGTAYTYDPAVDTEYKYLFEKYVMEELFNKGQNESDFVFQVINAFIDWQNGTELTKDELGKS
jgi:hypothetical protein